jgi:hypothetical protein
MRMFSFFCVFSARKFENHLKMLKYKVAFRQASRNKNFIISASL